jgi:RNA polymerase sigma-70 factor (ECF subfamily)
MTDECFEAVRPKLFGVAYRMLGEVGRAEDAVQEAYLRWHDETSRAGAEPIASAEAYLVTVVSRICIDELRSARARREQYVGEWLPEPLVSDESSDPARRLELSESLSQSFLVVLETLSPEQRAVFLLHDVFDYPYERIAAILDKSGPAVRQAAVRARRHVAERKPRFEPTSEQHERLADRFFAAVGDGDLSALESLLAGDVELHGDGGGKVPALARFLSGRLRVARTLVNWGRQIHPAGVQVERCRVNGNPGARMLDRSDRVISIVELELAGGEIRSVNSVVNPEKLDRAGVGVVGNLGEVLSGPGTKD